MPKVEVSLERSIAKARQITKQLVEQPNLNNLMNWPNYRTQKHLASHKNVNCSGSRNEDTVIELKKF